MNLVAALKMNGNEIRNAVLHLLAVAPAGPVEGQVYYDTALHKPRVRRAADWRAMDGTDARLDELQAPTGPVAMNGQKITGGADGTAATDFATKGQVDAAVAGLTWLEAPAKAMADANQAALAGLPTIDGVVLVDGDRLLLTAQATGSQNGPWVVHAGAWTRPADFANGSVEPSTDAMFVDGGAAYANTGWTISGVAAVTVDTTAHTWAQFTGLGDVTVTGPLLQKAGNVISTAWTPPKKVALSFGDGAAVSYALVHNLNTKDVVVQLRQTADDVQVFADVVHTDVNTVTVSGFIAAPAANALRATIIG